MSDGSGEWREDGDGDADTDACWDRLGRDLTALILSKLPLRSMLRATAVCKAWRAALRASPSLKQGRPWLFLHGRSNAGVPRIGRNAVAYDPDEPSSWVSFTLPTDCVAGAGGFAFTAPSLSHLAFAPLLRDGAWRHAPPLASSRCNPVIAAVPSGPSSERRHLFLVIGGGGFPGGLVDIEDRLPTELYEYDRRGDGAAAGGEWEQAAPLPEELRTGSSSSLSLSSALVGDRFFFVCGIYSCTVSAFDLARRAWTAPHNLCPVPGLVAAFVATGHRGRRLVLAGVEEGRCALGVWDVEPRTLAASKIGEMPADLAAGVLPGSVRCVGQDGLLYVLSEEEHRGYPACVCEVIDDDGDEMACRWSRLPPLPAPAGRSRFRRMVAFCSPVLLRNHLHTD
ncbi:hypothetical protein SETIT_7G071600v2 [Setaria italica]|uniref:F-box domain-containing protein n=1 Tax=Setaria italica TaxID=4555 RepID=A0A368RT70_SETIT|nr:F-box/kelch-repeat protein At3g24760 [Setaria italica]RCV33283.1 hypothetical protein SETIT_7G071600v2 [Setaria italica]